MDETNNYMKVTQVTHHVLLAYTDVKTSSELITLKHVFANSNNHTLQPFTVTCERFRNKVTTTHFVTSMVVLVEVRQSADFLKDSRILLSLFCKQTYKQTINSCESNITTQTIMYQVTAINATQTKHRQLLETLPKERDDRATMTFGATRASSRFFNTSR